MAGFKPRTFGVRSDRFANWATTTALIYCTLYPTYAMVVLAMIDEYFKDLLLTVCLHTTGNKLNWLQASLFERERERTLSAKQANLIRDRSIYSMQYLPYDILTGRLKKKLKLIKMSMLFKMLMQLTSLPLKLVLTSLQLLLTMAMFLLTMWFIERYYYYPLHPSRPKVLHVLRKEVAIIFWCIWANTKNCQNYFATKSSRESMSHNIFTVFVSTTLER